MVYNILFSNYGIVEKLLLLAAFVLCAVFAICLHEFAHGFAAEKMGDNTARIEGRLTLNPMRHFDPLGLAMFLLVGFGFARPVPINPYNFRNYRKGMLWTSFAGVIANFMQMLAGFGMMIGFGTLFITYGGGTNGVYYLLYFLFYFSLYVTLLNAALIAFNLLPIYPLDGFRVVETLTPHNNGYVRFMRQYGQYILIGIVLIGFLLERLNVPYGNIFGLYLGSIQDGILKLYTMIMGGILG